MSIPFDLEVTNNITKRGVGISSQGGICYLLERPDGLGELHFNNGEVIVTEQNFASVSSDLQDGAEYIHNFVQNINEKYAGKVILTSTDFISFFTSQDDRFGPTELHFENGETVIVEEEFIAVQNELQ